MSRISFIACNPQNVSGTQRYRFFASAALETSQSNIFKSIQSDKSITSFNNHSSFEKEAPFKKSKKKIQNNCQTQRTFQNCGIQTETVKVISPSRSKSQQERNSVQPLTALQLEKIARAKERREQEAALPPVTDKKSLEAYRIFLEENEKKDFELREKELDEAMNEKMKRIEQSLYERYEKSRVLNEEKVNLIRKTKLGELKRKESKVQSDQISDLSNKKLHIPHGENISQYLDMKKITNIKHNSGYLNKVKIQNTNKVKIQNTKKVKEDLELLTSLFQQV